MSMRFDNHLMGNTSPTAPLGWVEYLSIVYSDFKILTHYYNYISCRSLWCIFNFHLIEIKHFNSLDIVGANVRQVLSDTINIIYSYI